MPPDKPEARPTTETGSHALHRVTRRRFAVLNTDPPPPGMIDLGNGEAMCIGTAAQMHAAAEWLQRHYPDGASGERIGPVAGPILNSNYRVRQVLALGPLPERQLRLLVVLATWMDDYSLTVRLGFDTLTRETGNVRNTVRLARRELESDRRLSSKPGCGAGNLTVWTVHCLPEKGVIDLDPLSGSEKGVNQAAKRGSTEPGKGGQPERADLQEPDRGLNRLAKPSSSVPRARGSTHPDALAAEDELIQTIIDEIKTATGRTIETGWADKVRSEILNGNHAARPAAYVRAVIRGEPDPVTRFLPVSRPGYGKDPDGEPCEHGEPRGPAACALCRYAAAKESAS